MQQQPIRYEHCLWQAIEYNGSYQDATYRIVWQCVAQPRLKMLNTRTNGGKPSTVYACDDREFKTFDDALGALYYRQQCIVPFCKHTRKIDAAHSEWICAEHWKLVPRRIKRLKRAAKARNKSPAVQHFIWRMCKRWAIERAGGIA